MLEDLASYYDQVVVPLRPLIVDECAEAASGASGSPAQAVNYLTEEVHLYHRSERATLTYMAWWLANGARGSLAPARLAVASEIMHKSMLIHDDIVDDSPVRHNKPTLWKKYALESAQSEQADKFGQSLGIWSGNLLHSWANFAFYRIPEEHAGLNFPATMALWHRTYSDIWASQHSDLMTGITVGPPSIRTVREAAQLKGRYVASAPLLLGATLAGGGSKLLELLTAYGDSIGEGYIVRNDLEGIFAKPENVDAIPDDLRERRKSIVLAFGYEMASASQREVLDTAGDSSLTDEQVAQLKQILISTGAKDRAAAHSEELIGTAVRTIQESDIEDGAIEFLTAVAQGLLKVHKF